MGDIIVLKPSPLFNHDEGRWGFSVIINTPFEKTVSLGLKRVGETDIILSDFLMKVDVGEARLPGQLHAERLLQNPLSIPDEWRKYFLLFGGTVWKNKSNYRKIPFLLDLHNGVWTLSFSGLEDFISSRFRLVVFK